MCKAIVLYRVVQNVKCFHITLLVIQQRKTLHFSGEP